MPILSSPITSIRVSGDTKLLGDVVLAPGTNVLLSRSGKNITFSSTASGGGSPGGTDTQVQFNDALAFGGDAGLTYDKTTDTLTVVGVTVTPTIIGGTATTSDLNLKTTSGVGTTGADMHFLVGNNGATEAMTILNSGNVGVGTTAPSQALQVGTTSSIGNYISVVGASGDNTYVVFSGARKYPRFDLADTFPGGSTFNFWNLGNQIRFGTATGSAGLAAWYTKAGSSGDVIFNGNIGIGASVPVARFEVSNTSATNGLAIKGTSNLWQSTGNEIAYQLNYTTNKATSGNDTGLVINQTDTLSPGTSLLIDAQVAAGTKFNVSNAGAITTASTTHAITGTLASVATLRNVGNGILTLASNTHTNTSGTTGWTSILPTYNQASGTAANTDLLINRTETALGSGTQRFLDLQVGGTSKFNVDNSGDVISSGDFGIGIVPTVRLDVRSSGDFSGMAIRGTTWLQQPTGNEIAYQLNYTTNKATSGNDTGLEINMTDTASPGTSQPLKVTVGGSTKFAVAVDGAVDFYGATYHTSVLYPKTGTNTLQITGRFTNTTAGDAVGLATGGANSTWSNTSGQSNIVKITPIYNQASGTAANTDLLINRTETALGSGTQRLLDLQVGGTSKFNVDNTGSFSILESGPTPIFYTTFTAGNQAGNITYTLPVDDGTASQFLQTDGAGVLSWAAGGGGLTWSEVTGTSQSASINNGYITNNASLVTVTLPTTAALGSIVRVSGYGAGGWQIAQNASEQIHFGNLNTTSGVDGYLSSANRYDAVELVCVVADNEWCVISSVGSINIV